MYKDAFSLNEHTKKQYNYWYIYQNTGLHEHRFAHEYV